MTCHNSNILRSGEAKLPDGKRPTDYHVQYCKAEPLRKETVWAVPLAASVASVQRLWVKSPIRRSPAGAQAPLTWAAIEGMGEEPLRTKADTGRRPTRALPGLSSSVFVLRRVRNASKNAGGSRFSGAESSVLHAWSGYLGNWKCAAVSERCSWNVHSSTMRT